MKKIIILLGGILMNATMISCSADSVFGETDLQTETITANGFGVGGSTGNTGSTGSTGTTGGTGSGNNGGGNGTGSTTITPPPPPPPIKQ